VQWCTLMPGISIGMTTALCQGHEGSEKLSHPPRRTLALL
jgi:hypothetical protein